MQISDYRNFAHGRHYWLAERFRTTAVIGFVTRELANLADQTLKLIPNEIPVLRVDLPNEGVLTAIISIVYSLYPRSLQVKQQALIPANPLSLSSGGACTTSERSKSH